MTTAVSKLVAAALELHKVALKYRVEMHPREAREFVALAGHYNEFDPKKILILLDRIGEIVPTKDYGPNNPNTGYPSHSFSIGREGSPVIYLKIPSTVWVGRGKDEALQADLINAIQAEAKKAEADEYHAELDKWKMNLIIRIWWD